MKVGGLLTASAVAGALLLLLVSPGGTSAQTPETDICACTPGGYKFTFDFDLFCPPVNITRGDAIASTSCSVGPYGDELVTDLKPVSVQSIQIVELNQRLQVVVQESISGTFGDGDSFEYVSIVSTPEAITDPVDLPRAIQLNIIGVNAEDQALINIFIITFTNDCGTYPALDNGASAGWVVLRELSPGVNDFCPLAPTREPTDLPTSPPIPSSPEPTTVTGMPTVSETAVPTQQPPTSNPVVPTLPPTLRTSRPTSMSMSMDLEDMDEILFSADEFGRSGKKWGKKSAEKTRLGLTKATKSHSSGDVSSKKKSRSSSNKSSKKMSVSGSSSKKSGTPNSSSE